MQEPALVLAYSSCFHLLLRHVITRLFFIISLSVNSRGLHKDQASGNCKSGLQIISDKGFSHKIKNFHIRNENIASEVIRLYPYGQRVEGSRRRRVARWIKKKE